jgi:hypothetical protein
MGEKCPINLAYNCDFHRNCRVLLKTANLRHGTDGFTSPPKGGILSIFSPRIIRRLRPGLYPRTWVPEASTLTTRPPKALRGYWCFLSSLLPSSEKESWKMKKGDWVRKWGRSANGALQKIQSGGGIRYYKTTNINLNSPQCVRLMDIFLFGAEKVFLFPAPYAYIIF